jgi:hypothetical protein
MGDGDGIIRIVRFCGPVAQLGARFHGMEEVKGSNPFRSTKTLPPFFGNRGQEIILE